MRTSKTDKESRRFRLNALIEDLPTHPSPDGGPIERELTCREFLGRLAQRLDEAEANISHKNQGKPDADNLAHFDMAMISVDSVDERLENIATGDDRRLLERNRMWRLVLTHVLEHTTLAAENKLERTESGGWQIATYASFRPRRRPRKGEPGDAGFLPHGTVVVKDIEKMIDYLRDGVLQAADFLPDCGPCTGEAEDGFTIGQCGGFGKARAKLTFRFPITQRSEATKN